MAWPVLPHGFLGAQGSETDSYRIERSLRFNSADSAYLNRTPASAGNRKTWTWSGWVKRNKTGQNDVLFDASNNASTTMYVIRITSANDLEIGGYVSSYNYQIVTTQLFRDLSAWYHIVVAFDTTETTASNRVKLYVNGSQVTSFSASSYPTLNFDGLINNNVQHRIGSAQFASQLFDGYLTEINFIDGQALTPSSFGETDAITGRWKAKAYSGTYGTNGFYLKFADNSGTTATTLGKDSSPNGNNWTPNNFSVTAGAGNDSLVDSPTNYGTDTGLGGEVRGNYCTINPLKTDSSITLANGNLDLSVGVANNKISVAGIGVSSGKWYWEFLVRSRTLGAAYNGGIEVGVSKEIFDFTDPIYNQGIIVSGNNGSVYNLGSVTVSSYIPQSSGYALIADDVAMVALDMDNGKVWFGKNGTWGSVSGSAGNPSSGTNSAASSLSGTYFPSFGMGADTGSQACSVNFGQRPFAYAAPSGFKALCTTNLPTPTIKKPSSYMDVVTYTGNGSTQTISSLGFSPDLVWGKSRSAANWHILIDSVRGSSKYLNSNRTDAEGTDSTIISSLDSNGFTLGSNATINGNSNTNVAWAWDEAPIAGMDIVAYTGDGTTSANRLINHSLGVKPDFVITKKRSGGTDYGWSCWHKDLGGNYGIWLDKTDARNVNMWAGYSNFSATKFTPPDLLYGNENGSTYVNYLFAEVEGFSRFGSYTGNGSSDGPFVWCGFRPRYWIIKRTDSSGGWWTWDTARNLFNPANSIFRANNSHAEDTDTTNYNIDFLSNGFKVRATSFTADGGINVSGGTYIFCAFAESPFKYARAR